MIVMEGSSTVSVAYSERKASVFEVALGGTKLSSATVSLGRSIRDEN